MLGSGKTTVWTDGSRLESGEVGVALAFWRDREWARRGTFLGKDKEVFDAEVFAIMQTVRLLDERNESGRDYTIFSDAQAAIARVLHDRCGPAQAPVRAVIAAIGDLCGRGNTLNIRWTPSHEGVEGNERADETAKSAAEGREERAELGYLRGTSLSHLMRKTAEERADATREWVRGHVGRRHRYRAPPGGKATEGTRDDKKGAGRTLLSASFRTCGHGGPPSKDRSVTEGSLLAVR